MRCEEIFNDRFIANFPEIVTVKEFWKLVNIWWSYAKDTVVCLFLDTVYSVVFLFLDTVYFVHYVIAGVSLCALRQIIMFCIAVFNC